MMRVASMALCGLGLSALLGCGGSGSGECRTDGYPPAPSGATSIVHVSAGCSDEGADGSAEKPYGSIGQAIESADAGAAILVASGTYEENVVVDKSVSIIGSADCSKSQEAGIIVQAPSPYGIIVKAAGGESVRLCGFRVSSAEAVGVWVQSGSVTLEGSRVEGTVADGDGKYGHAVLASSEAGSPGGDSSIIVQNSAITSSAGIGIAVSNARAIIVQNQVGLNDGGGVRVDLGVGDVQIEDNQIEGNSGVGVGVFSTKAIIVQNEIVETGAVGQSGQEIGYGIVVADLLKDGTSLGPTDVTIQDNAVTDSAVAGIFASGDARGIIVQNQVSRNGARDDLTVGAGIWIQAGAGGQDGFQIEGNTVSENGRVGIGLTTGARAIIVQNEVTKTAGKTVFSGLGDFMAGDGISLVKGAFAQVQKNTIQGNSRLGLVADGVSSMDVWSTSAWTENTVSDNDEGGIIVQSGTPQPPDNLGNQGVAEIPGAPYPVQDREFPSQ
jgi:hypothetical protein